MKKNKEVMFVVRIDNKVLYDKSQAQAYEVLINYSDGALPVDPFKIIKKLDNVQIYSYKECMEKLKKIDSYEGMTEKQMLDALPSNEGFTTLIGDTYNIFFNEKKPPARIRWTIFHELGHFFLKHFDECECVKNFFTDPQEYEDTLEKEANCFARHCSSPLPIALYLCFHKRKPLSIELFKSCFDMSDETSKICLKHLKKFTEYYSCNKHEKLIGHFKEKIRESDKHLHAKLCVNRWNNFIELIKKI